MDRVYDVGLSSQFGCTGTFKNLNTNVAGSLMDSMYFPRVVVGVFSRLGNPREPVGKKKNENEGIRLARRTFRETDIAEKCHNSLVFCVSKFLGATRALILRDVC